MNKRYQVAFILYGLCTLILAIFAARYFFATELAPHHAAALQQQLATALPNAKEAFLAMYRAIGAGMFSTTVALGYLLLVPFRRREAWGRWALTLVTCTFAGLSVYFTLAFRLATGQESPWLAALLSLLLVVVAHILAKPSNAIA